MVRGPILVVRETLLRGEGTGLCRAVRQRDRTPVLLEIGSPARAYELTRGMLAHAVLHPIARTIHEGQPALVLEDFDGVPLRTLLGQPMSVERFLTIALQIAEALAEIHREGVIHKDVKPEHILVDPASAAVKIVGFGIAVRVHGQELATPDSQLIEGSLPYMSPEQTGRMRRALDHRSDLYSLGVTFYEMLTGGLPFEAAGPLEWAYCHVAHTPPPPIERVPALPVVVSDIVSKLLSKGVEDRYQTARGLAADLAKCLERWTTGRTIAPFALGQFDVAERLHIAERLYAREVERAQVLSAFDRVVATGAPELVLVAGPSGVGKSSLVRELYEPSARACGCFVTGKADQHGRSVPYSTIAAALGDLALEVLVESEARISELRRDLEAALGENARVIVDVVPQVALLLGEPPPAISLGPEESKHRFLALCQKFVSVFARKGHPVTLFVDDLQWADAASLELLQYLVSHPDMRNLLAVGAYRDVDADSPQRPVAVADQVKQTTARVTELRLGPLSPEHLTQLVADAVHETRDVASPLAMLVHRKTQGNPFFAVQFMRMLELDRLLEFDGAALRWRWDVARIEARDYTDNVVELMVRKIESLPAEARTILTLAACVGTVADAGTLTLVSNRPEDAVHRDLQPAVEEGLLLRVERSYRFLHDRIQQAAHSRIPADQQSAFHLAIGRSLLASRNGIDSHLFEIANHYLLGKTAITEPSERGRGARLFLDAGKRAKASTAYRDAVTFFSAGISLLAAESSGLQHELAYDLRFELAECQWLTGDFASVERALPSLLACARSTVEKFRIHGIEVRLHSIRGEYGKATEAGLRALRAVGIDWPLHPTAERVKEENDRVWELLGGRPIEALLELPTMTNLEMRAAVDFVTLLFDPAFLVDWNLHGLLASFMVSASLKHGNEPSSFMGYVIFALHCADQARYADAERFADVAYRSLERPESRPYEPKICAALGVSVIPWIRSYRTAVAYLERGLRAGTAIGDVLYSAYCANVSPQMLLEAGETLDEVDRECERRSHYLRSANYSELAAHASHLQRFVRTLCGKRSDEAGHADVGGDETWSFARIGRFVYRLQEAYLFGEYELAQQTAALVRPHVGYLRALIASIEFGFYDALALAAGHGASEPPSGEESTARIRQYERQFRVWETGCPENFGAQRALLAAELDRVSGRELEAERHYAEAVTLARDAGLVHVEAIANEVAARFYAARGLPFIAKAHRCEARRGYARWGALAKVRQLDRSYPELVEPTGSSSASISFHSEQLDVLSVVKAAQTISAELDLDRLTGKLVEVVLEQCGAELGRLLLMRDGELVVESEARATAHGIESLRPAKTGGLVPESIMNFVWRTGRKVLLEDARAPAGRGRFASDEYLSRERPRSILCVPIVRGSAPVGLLYLENKLVTHAFTPERIAALDVIASQAAITLESAFWIRQEHEARTALAASEARFRRLSDSNMVGIIFTDIDGRLLEANDYFLNLIGLGSEEVAEGRVLWTTLTPPDSWERDKEAVRELEQTGVCRPFEKEFLRRDGTRVPVLIGATLLEGSMTETVAYVIDITERRRAEASRDRLLVQEQQARATAEEALRVRDEFLSISAHELRTPLTPLKMQIEVLGLLADQAIPTGAPGREKLLDMLARSNAQVDRLARLMNDLLDFSRIGAGRLVLSKESFDLADLVREVVARSQVQLDRAGCTIDVSSVEPTVGRWDRPRIEQVVSNVLTNAIKYGAGKPISVRLRARADEVILEVVDHGIGIDAKDHERIFGRFERAVSIRNFGGFGLGLHIAREVVRAHGGDIRVESRLGEGATFIVRLPRDVATAVVADTTSDDVVPTSGLSA